MQAVMNNWRDVIKRTLFHGDQHYTLWQIAYACTFFIPLMLVGHRTASDVLCCVVGVLFLLHSASTKNWRWLRDPTVIILLIAWVWLVFVVTPLADYIPYSASLAGPWIRFIIFYAAMRHWVLTRPGPIKWMATVVFTWLIFVSIDTLWQYVHGISLTNNLTARSGRLTGPFGNVKVGIYLTRLILPAFCICLFFILRRKYAAPAAIICALLYCMIFATIAVSGERTAFALSIVGITTVFTLLIIAEPKIRTICLTALATFLAIVLVLIHTQSWIYARLEQVAFMAMDFRETSYGGLYWVAHQLATDGHLLHGIGLKNFRELCPDYMALGMIRHCNLHPHNIYVEWYVETGLVGLGLFIAFAGSLFAYAIKIYRGCSGIYRVVPAFTIGALAVLLFPFAPTQSFFSNWPAILFWFSLSLAISSLSLAKDKHATHGQS